MNRKSGIGSVLRAAHIANPDRKIPFVSVTTPEEGLELYKHQKGAFRVLAPEMWRRIVFPMGAGKSVTIKALALHDVYVEGRKALIIYPQTFIGEGFDRSWINLPNGMKLEFSPREADERNVEEIVDFITKPINLASRRVMHCTYAAFLLAVTKHDLLDKKKDVFAGVSLFIDEGHHVSLSDVDESDFDDDERETYKKTQVTANRLGQVVTHYLNRKSGPLTIVTATWSRVDGTILPSQTVQSFKSFALPIDEYMEAMRWLRNVDFKFVAGDPVESTAKILESEDTKTLVLMGYHKTAAEKQAKLAKLQRRIRHLGRRVCDLVTNDGGMSVKNQDDLRDAIRAEKDAKQALAVLMTEKIKKKLVDKEQADVMLGRQVLKLPGCDYDVVIARNRFIEGADWPALERIIMMEPRGSIVATLQILGRALRDWPGKTRAEVYVIIPSKTSKVDPAKIGDYLKVVFASMVCEWQFKLPTLKTRTAAEKMAKQILGNPANTEAVAGLSRDLALKSIFKDGKALGDVDRAIVDALGSTNPDVLKPDVKQAVCDILGRLLRDKRSQFIRKTCDDVPVKVDLVEEMSGIVRCVVSSMGYETLREVREGLKYIGVRERILPFIKHDVENYPKQATGVIEFDPLKRKWAYASHWLHRNGFGWSFEQAFS